MVFFVTVTVCVVEGLINVLTHKSRLAQTNKKTSYTMINDCLGQTLAPLRRRLRRPFFYHFIDSVLGVYLLRLDVIHLNAGRLFSSNHTHDSHDEFGP